MTSVPVTTATVVDAMTPAPDIRILRLKPDQAVPYKAGQYVELTFASHEPRAFSIANAPHGDFIEFHVRDAGHGGASTYAVRSLALGEKVSISQAAFGDCTVERVIKGNSVLAIAGGLGIAPLKAVCEHMIERGHDDGVFLYWGVREKKDLYLDKYLKTLARPKKNKFVYKPLVGHAVGEVASDDFVDLHDFTIFLSGPMAMVSATIPFLLARGAKRGQILTDSTALSLWKQNP
jgi:NAD(P)H-flavin reductase